MSEAEVAEAAQAANDLGDGAHTLQELAGMVEDEGDEDPAEDADRPTPSQPRIRAQDVENWTNWCTNAPLLYDLFLGVSMEWPALCAEWLPDEPGEGCRLAIGTQTDQSELSEVLVVELTCATASRIDAANAWRSWPLQGLGEAEGFGCEPLDEEGVLRPLARMKHPTEVNRIAVCPHRPQLIATKAATGAVLLHDYKGQRASGEVCPDALLTASGPGSDGFALGWSTLEKSLLASGGMDGRLGIWDVEVSSKVASTPLQEFIAHEGPLGDLSFSRTAPSVVATVGDDRHLRLWDSRAAPASSAASAPKPRLSRLVCSEGEALSVDWSYHQDWTLATTAQDGTVKIWDMRSPGSPSHELKGHNSRAVAVRWAPFRAGLLASCGSDSRVCLWDLVNTDRGRVQDEPVDGEPEPPELLLAHSGHGEGVSDLSWSHTDEYLICSVAEDNSLQIWQPSTVFYLDESEGEEAPDGQGEAEPPSKRARQ